MPEPRWRPVEAYGPNARPKGPAQTPRHDAFRKQLEFRQEKRREAREAIATFSIEVQQAFQMRNWRQTDAKKISAEVMAGFAANPGMGVLIASHVKKTPSFGMEHQDWIGLQVWGFFPSEQTALAELSARPSEKLRQSVCTSDNPRGLAGREVSVHATPAGANLAYNGSVGERLFKAIAETQHAADWMRRVETSVSFMEAREFREWADVPAPPPKPLTANEKRQFEDGLARMKPDVLGNGGWLSGLRAPQSWDSVPKEGE